MSDIQDEVQDNVPEVDDQTADMFANDEPEIDPDNPDGELPEEPKPEPETLEISIEGFDDEIPPEQDTPVLKRVRDRLKEETRARKAAERALAEREAQSAPAKRKLGPEPTLERPTDNPDHAYDEFEFKKAMKEWVQLKYEIEQEERREREKEESRNKAWKARLDQYDAEKASLPVSDYAEAEEAVQGAFNQTQLGILVKAAGEPAKLVYALGKNERALEHMAKITDPIDFAWELRGMVERMKKTDSKSNIPAPERVVRGSRSIMANGPKDLEALRQKLLKEGKPLDEFYRAREKMRG